MTEPTRAIEQSPYREGSREIDRLASLPAGLRARIEAEVAPGEVIEWAGQPIPERAAMREIAVTLFAIPWTAFAVFWVSMASRGSLLFAAFGLPFVGIGLSMLARPFLAYRNARRSAYALTDRRAIHFQASANGSMTVRSFGPDDITALQRIERYDGSGDVIFSQVPLSSGRGRYRVENVGFLEVRDCQLLEKRVRAMKQAADRSAAATP